MSEVPRITTGQKILFFVIWTPIMAMCLVAAVMLAQTFWFMPWFFRITSLGGAVAVVMSIWFVMTWERGEQ